MALTMEEKILGVEPKEEKKAKEVVKSFEPDVLWTVSKKGCGSCLMSGRMVYEMLDFDAKKQVLAGKKEVICGDITFKLKK